MRESNLFSWLSQYHLDANIRPNLPFIVNGRYLNTQNAKPIEEGEENPQTYGALILADGDNLVRRLKKEKIILDLSTPVFSSADNYDLFAGYLSKNSKKDGAFVHDVGTKTDLAMVLPVSHTREDSSVHAYQIKATAHNQLGFGKVAHFGPEGLVEELFFKYAPESEGPFVCPDQKIAGIHRVYQRGKDDQLYVASQRTVGPTLEQYFKNQK